MRRKDREITDPGVIEEIISASSVCRIAMCCDDGVPYLVPLCFGYVGGVIYLHSSREGKKVEAIKHNNRVCFEFDTDVMVIESDRPCGWSMRYRSVIGLGRAYFVEDEAEKKLALDAIMRNYSGLSNSRTYGDLRRVLIIKIVIESMTGKESGF